MRLDVIDNSGATSMIAELRKELDTCWRARLATASLTRGGIRFIEEALCEVRSNLKIQLLVGLYNGHTEAAALRRLLNLQKRFGDHLEVRIANIGRFHWKTYLFDNKSGATAFVGSSNLTNDGLSAEGEFNIRLNSASMSGYLTHVAETFDRFWKKHSKLLTKDIAEEYAPVSNQSKEAILKIGPIIRGILRPPKRGHEEREPIKVATILTSVEGSLCRATIKAVKDKTKWYSNGWLYMVCSRKADRDRLEKAGAFYLADFREKRMLLSLNDVRDTDEFKTEDGQYLVAYKTRKGSVPKYVSPTIFTRLKREGLIKTKEDLRRDRRLSRSHRELLNSLLRVPLG